jgi:hypothetical protein
VSGPYETERDAINAVRHILDTPPGTGAWRDGSLRTLETACQAAGVKLGAYDQRILVWLAGWEPQACAVIAALIERAYEAAADRVLQAYGPGPGEDLAGELGRLADQIEARLGNEHADRQTIAEDTVAELRKLGGAR